MFFRQMAHQPLITEELQHEFQETQAMHAFTAVEPIKVDSVMLKPTNAFTAVKPKPTEDQIVVMDSNPSYGPVIMSTQLQYLPPKVHSKVKKPKKGLVQAVQRGDKTVVNEWISYLKVKPRNEKGKRIIDQFDFDESEGSFFNAVHYAVINNDVQTLQQLCDAEADLNNTTNEEIENPPLVLAALRLSDDLFKEGSADNTDYGPGISQMNNSELKTTFHTLLQHSKVDVNGQNRSGITALHVACSKGNSHMVKELLRVETIDINKKDKHLNTPLHTACVCGNQNIVEPLIKSGANLKEKNIHGMHPLHVAVVERNLEAVTTILGHADQATLLHETDKGGHSAFLLAVMSGDELIVKFLLDTKAVTIMDKNEIGQNCFHLSAAINKEKIMQMIYDYDVPSAEQLLDDVDQSDNTPLHYAARYYQDEPLIFLMDKGANLECRNDEYKTPLLTAAAAGSVKVMQLLIQNGADVTVTDKYNGNIVHSIVLHGHVDELKTFFKLDDSVKLINAKGHRGFTPLHMACQIGLYEIAVELLKKGAKVTVKDEDGSSPLHMAAVHGHLKLVMLLISNYADIDVTNEATGWTPLTFAAAQGHLLVVEYLLKSGADVDGKFSPEKLQRFTDSEKTSWNTTPLLTASYYGNVDVVELLLKNGADVTFEDAETDNGTQNFTCNCLVTAILHGHRDVALAIINSDSWQDALRWRAENDRYGLYTPMKLLIKKMPDVATAVLDKCVHRKQNSDGSVLVTYNYEFLDDIPHDFSDDLESIYDDDDDDDDDGDEIFDERLFSEDPEPIEYTIKEHRDWVASHFKKEAHALKVMVDSERIELLNHPLATKLLDYKWRSFGLYLYLLNLITYCVFLGILTAFALSSPTPNSDELRSNTSLFSNGEDCKVNYFLFAAAVIIITISLIRIFIEMIQIYYLRLAYIFELDNWMEFCLFVSSIIFVSYGLQSGCQCPAFWQWQFGAFTILLAWLGLVLFLKKFPLTGVYVLMFVDILNTFMKMILLSALFVVSFGLTFYMIFYRPGERSSFSSPGRSLIKTFVMTTGELDFDGIFFNSQEDAEEGNNLFYPQVAYILWIVFIILMPIILTNLLIGLAVDDIKGIQNNAALKRLALKVDLTLHIEEFAFIRNFFRKEKETLQFKTEVGNQILKRNQFYTNKRDSLWQKLKQLSFGSNDKVQVDDTQPLSSADEIKKEIAQLKTMIKEINEKVKADHAEISKVKDMITAKIDQHNHKLEMLLEQNKVFVKYLKEKFPASENATGSASEIYTTVTDDDEAATRTVESGHTKLPSRSDDDDDD